VDNRYRPIIGHFADNQHWPITTLVSADRRLHNWKVQVFTALHVMQTRYSEENSVCPSVRLSHA